MKKYGRMAIIKRMASLAAISWRRWRWLSLSSVLQRKRSATSAGANGAISLLPSGVPCQRSYDRI